MEFNEKLQQLRKQKALTQEELAKALYVSRTAISKWESGRGCPTIDSLKAISEFFGVSIDELIGYDETQLQEEINNIIKKYWELYFLNPIEATKLIRKAYIKYSNNSYIMH